MLALTLKTIRGAKSYVNKIIPNINARINTKFWSVIMH